MKRLTTMLEHQSLTAARSPSPVAAKLRRHKKFPSCVLPITALVVWAGLTSTCCAMSEGERDAAIYTLNNQYYHHLIGGGDYHTSMDLIKLNFANEHPGATTLGVTDPPFFFTSRWEDATGAPVVGPTIGSINYYRLGPDEDPLVFSNYSLLGTSTDAGSQFYLSCALPTDEPSLILAVPYDPLGSQIVIPDPAYDAAMYPAWLDNLALGVTSEIPEPASLSLLGVGAVVWLASRRRGMRATKA